MSDAREPGAGTAGAEAVAVESGDGAGQQSQPPVVVTTGNAAPAEIAAVTAVISGLLAEEGDARREAEPTGTTAWQRSQRSLRGPLEPGRGRWNG